MGRLLEPAYGTATAAIIANKNLKVGSFESDENTYFAISHNESYP